MGVKGRKLLLIVCVGSIAIATAILCAALLSPERRAFRELEALGVELECTGRGPRELGMCVYQTVIVDDADFDDATLAAAREPLGRFAEEVVYFDLSHTRITEAGLEHLPKFRPIVWLWLCDTRVTGENLSMLDGRGIRRLHLCGDEFGDEDIDEIATITELRYLGVWKTRLTDQGIKRIGALRPDMEVFEARMVEWGPGWSADVSADEE
ncbi:MAG: hypothetical protein DWQ34_13385 [Planctomycetota bacterium]|nr:MAG: hypothetical protein DWQ34_13385 [Planctomycetota bacterium]REJ96251.1 MAG: hypothetical protein DWQ29_00955 [Planctomycetota bacterium]REK27382.1 MAG: hypothetical protein DWQ41_08455 [Planctomycetota bacterium]REK36597.1 MAG: hypothetical protein DWQ45_08175 [Planctomycetota bacterium]